METKLEQIAVKAVNQLPKSVVREIRTPRSVGAGGGRPPPATRWALSNERPYRDRRVYAEVSQEAAFRQDKTASGSSVSRSGATEGVPDRGRAFDAGSRSYVDINTSQIFGGSDHRIHEREEFDMDRAECRTQDAEFSGPQILGRGGTLSRPLAGTRKGSGP